MKETRRLIITTTRRRILRLRPLLVCARCPVCGREVETLAQAQAAEALEISLLRLDALLAEGRLHAIPTVSGSVRICRDSLFG